MNVEGSFKDVSENQCAMGLSCSSMTGSADASNCVNQFNCTLAAIETSYSRLGSYLDIGFWVDGWSLSPFKQSTRYILPVSGV